MEIIYLGHSSFRLSNKNLSILTDPFDPEMVGLKFPKIQADYVTISHEHADHNNADLVEGAKRVFRGPGEYEVEGISFSGIQTFHDSNKGVDRGKNTVFAIDFDGIRIAHLGDLGHKLTESQINALGDVDILMIPVGGYFTFELPEAVETTRAIEPKIVIPMHYQVPQMNTKLSEHIKPPDAFIAELGLKVEKMNKLTVKQGSFPIDEQAIVLLERK